MKFEQKQEISIKCKEMLHMRFCEFVTFISILACQIAKDKTNQEISCLGAFFTQLRRYFNNNFILWFKLASFRCWDIIWEKTSSIV